MRTAAILLLFLPLSVAIFSKHLSLRHRGGEILSATAVQKCLPHTRTPCCMRLKGAQESAPREPDGFVQERLLEDETSACGDSCHASSECMIPFAVRRERDGDAFDILPSSSTTYEGCISASIPVWAPPTVVVGFGFKGSLAFEQRESEREKEITMDGLIALRIGLDLVAISPSLGGTFSVSWTFDLPERVTTFTSALGYVVRKYVWDKIKDTAFIRFMQRILEEKEGNWNRLARKIKKYEKLSTQPQPLIVRETDGRRTACLPNFEIDERAEHTMHMEGIALVDEMANHIHEKLLLMQSWDDSDLQEEGSLVRAFQDLRRGAKEQYATLCVLTQGEDDYKPKTRTVSTIGFNREEKADANNENFWKDLKRITPIPFRCNEFTSPFGNDYMETIRATVSTQAEHAPAKFKKWIENKINKAKTSSKEMTKLYKELFAQTYLDVFYPTKGGGNRATRLHKNWWQIGHKSCSEDIDRGYVLREDTDITSEDIYRKEMRYQIRLRLCGYNKGGFFDASDKHISKGRDNNLHDAAGFMFGHLWPTGESHRGLKEVTIQSDIASLWGKFSDGWSNYRGTLEAQMKDPPQSYLGRAIRTGEQREYKTTEDVCEAWGYMMGRSNFLKIVDKTKQQKAAEKKYCLDTPYIAMVIALSKSHENFINSCEECTTIPDDENDACPLKEQRISAAAVASIGTAGQDASNICQDPTLVAVDMYVEKSVVSKRVGSRQTCTYEKQTLPASYVFDLRVSKFSRFVSERQSKTTRFTFEVAIPTFFLGDIGDEMSGFELNYLPTNTPTASSLTDLIGTNSEAFVAEKYVVEDNVNVKAILTDFMIRIGMQVGVALKREISFDVESNKLRNEAFEGDNPVVKVVKAMMDATQKFMDEHVVKRFQKKPKPPTCVAMSTLGEVDRIFEQLTSSEKGPLRGFPDDNDMEFNSDMLNSINEIPMDCAKCDASDGACDVVKPPVESKTHYTDTVLNALKEIASASWHILGPVAEEILMPSSVYRLGVVVELDDEVVRTCIGDRTKRCETDSNCIGKGGTCNAVRICSKNPSTVCTRPQDCDGEDKDNLCVLAEMQKCQPECVDTDEEPCPMCFSKHCEKNPAVDCTGSEDNDHSRCRSDNAIDRGPCNEEGVCTKAKFLKCRGEGVLFDQSESEACMWWPKSESQVGENVVRKPSDKGRCVRSPRNDITFKFHAKTERQGTIEGGKMTGYLKKTGKYELLVIKLNRRLTGHTVAKYARIGVSKMAELAKRLPGALGDVAEATGQAIKRGANRLPGALRDGAETAGQAIKNGVETTGRVIKRGTDATGRAIKSGAEAAVEATKKGGRAIKSGAEAAVEATKIKIEATTRALIAASERSLLFRATVDLVQVTNPAYFLPAAFVPAIRRVYIAQILRLSTELSTLAQDALGFFSSVGEAVNARIAALELYADCAVEAYRAKQAVKARIKEADSGDSTRDTDSTRQMDLVNKAYNDLYILTQNKIEVSNIDNLMQLRDDGQRFQAVMEDSDMAKRIVMHCYGVKYPNVAQFLSENLNVAPLSVDAVDLMAMASEDLIDLKLALDSAAKLAASAAAEVETDISGNEAFLMVATGDDDDLNDDDLSRIVRKRNAEALAKSDVAIKILKLKVSMLCEAAKEASPLENAATLSSDLESLAEQVYLKVNSEAEGFFSRMKAFTKSALNSAIAASKEAYKAIRDGVRATGRAFETWKLKRNIKKAWEERLKLLEEGSSKELLTAMCVNQCQISNPDTSVVENTGAIEAPAEDLDVHNELDESAVESVVDVTDESTVGSVIDVTDESVVESVVDD